MAIWINELHYDNSGTDTGEFIELAGTAGIDLTDWSLVLYNGTGGLSYDTISLSGIIADESSGIGTVSFAATGLQNGSPDGVALVDPFGNVVEFISYEGTFQAMDGPAFGLTSTDIGVSESGLDAAGGSLALTGSGNEASDFTWSLVTNDTPGTINTTQAFVPVATPDYVNLQFPSSTTTTSGQATETIYGQIYEAGLTESAGAPTGVVAQLGYGPAGTDPSAGGWTWVDATYNTQVGNNDEYMATLTIENPGFYSYTFRFAIQDGSNPLEYTYADTDGAGTNPGLTFDLDKLGALTVSYEDITGTSGPDTLNGDGNAELISGLGDNDQLHGGAGNDQLVGGAGNDFLGGDDGDDLLEGGLGDDTIQGGADLFGDTVTYAHASGSVQVNLGAGTASGADGNDTIVDVEGVTGSAFNDTLVGADNVDGIDTLSGGAGDDTLDGAEGTNVLDGGDGVDTVTYASAHAGMTISLNEGGLAQGSDSRNDQLYSIENAIGSDFDDFIFGNDGNNVLNGGLGADDLEGFGGDDQYWVDNVGDTVQENASAGTDEVRSTIGYTLTANVENLTLLGTANIDATGNALANVLVGNSGNNRLNGASGADTMSGGAGDDIYYVNEAGDLVTETSNHGTDTVRSSITYTLKVNVENLVLTGTADLNGTGNTLANSLTGNAGANILNGAGGADSMRGGAGNDTYVVNDIGDRAIESASAGTDTVKSGVTFRLGSNVENLTLTGSTAINGTGNDLANTMKGNNADNSISGLDGADKLYGYDGLDRLTGGLGNDVLDGGAGNDTLEGGVGQDRMTGGTGADFFLFRDGDLSGATTATADRIMDFSHTDGDRIRLSYMDANTANGSGTNEAFSFIGTAAFSHVAGQLRYQEISGNTYVSGDTNGDGVADFMIRVDGSHAFVSGDFVL